MQIFRFDQSGAGKMDRFGSSGVAISNIAHLSLEAQAILLFIEPGGRVGDHPAATQQLFLVIAGQGWVRSEEEEPVPIQAGEGAFWEAGERHESGSDEGMTVIVIESEAVELPGSLRHAA
jgi:quercetin dioxygenase-like cupin family protein